LPSSGCDLAPSLGHGFGMPMGYLPFAALAAIHLGGPQGDTARLTVEDSRVDGTESGVPQPDRLTVLVMKRRRRRQSHLRDLLSMSWLTPMIRPEVQRWRRGEASGRWVAYVPYDPSAETPDEGGTNGRRKGFDPYASQTQRRQPAVSCPSSLSSSRSFVAELGRNT
jgi:hypothetical protein